jgi:YHS domain-containing protein
MTLIVRMLRYLFWILLVSWVARLLARLVSQMGNAASEPRPPVREPSDAVSRKLVRDPVCGIHVSEALAVPFERGNETIYFCSLECRGKYLDGEKQFTASA